MLEAISTPGILLLPGGGIEIFAATSILLFAGEVVVEPTIVAPSVFDVVLATGMIVPSEGGVLSSAVVVIIACPAEVGVEPEIILLVSVAIRPVEVDVESARRECGEPATTSDHGDVSEETEAPGVPVGRDDDGGAGAGGGAGTGADAAAVSSDDEETADFLLRDGRGGITRHQNA